MTNDGFYVKENERYWLASPSADSSDVTIAGKAYVGHELLAFTNSVRPVVCLSADIPAAAGVETNFTINI